MEMTKEEISKIIQDLLDDKGGDWDWEDFIETPITNDRYLEEIRLRCAQLPDEFPPTEPKKYCGPEGEQYLRDVLKELQK